MENRTVSIQTEYIKLDSLLKFAALCMSGGEAKEQIAQGRVHVNGQICTPRGKKCYPGDRVTFQGVTVEITPCS